MLRTVVASLLSHRQRRFLRAKLNAARVRFARRFRSYDSDKLLDVLRSMGVQTGDSLMVHANFRQDSGYLGTPQSLMQSLTRSVDDHGHLMMVSIPFRGYAYDYLDSGKRFDVRKTVSMMGLVSELFRRSPEVVRSLHPTHPVVVRGPRAAEITAAHPHCLYPTGERTPFDELCRLDGKVLMFDVGFGAITLFHYVEHLLRDRLGFPLYADRVFEAPVIGYDGQAAVVRTVAFAKGARRHQTKLLDAMMERGLAQVRRVGNTSMILVRARDVVSTMSALVDSGVPLIEAPAGDLP